MTSKIEEIQHLENPPIYEVICEIHTEKISNLDALSQGHFWSTIREEFPYKEVKPPIAAHTGLNLQTGTPKTRGWFKNSEENYLIQLQDDRFVLNWRRTGDTYPRFGNQGGQNGIVDKTLEIFNDFEEFCEKNLKEEPSVKHLELGKINVLQQNEYWDNVEELSEIIPCFEGLFSQLNETSPRANIAYQTTSANGQKIQTKIQSAQLAEVQNEKRRQAFRVEFRARKSCASNDEEVILRKLSELNTELNYQFLETFPNATEHF
jgi:uncharacterized protein (TIGR04255 family)